MARHHLARARCAPWLVVALLATACAAADRGPDGVYASDDQVVTIRPMGHDAYVFASDGQSDSYLTRSGRVLAGRPGVTLTFTGDTGWDEFSLSSHVTSGQRFHRLTPDQAVAKRRQLARDRLIGDEGVMDLQSLWNAESSLYDANHRYSVDVAPGVFFPKPCADGTRAPLPGPPWTVAGCHFVYRMELVGDGTAYDGGVKGYGRGVRDPVVGVELELGSQGLERGTAKVVKSGP